ncbi:hypothetical protein [Parapedobacter koreensis]|uniref:Right handed beta helix region n=1 Tax=Parapedobacter koreensis TaxID=332977 RepID=A0A1H7F8X9_9SPHI|nr:hypothetical protein [Parapedobacter koreensis]SEK22601.1 hypothetical protein SAMN05421740_101273 [Parapedobacter koreensis]
MIKQYLNRTQRLFVFFLSAAVLVAACSKNNDGPSDPPEEEEEEEVVDGISGDLTEVSFQAGESYDVVGDIFVPEGASVTIPAGVTLEFQEGPNGEAWFLEVFGSLYILGEENDRVVLTPSEELLASSKNQGIGQLWGGIIGTNTAGDLVIQYADILHAGGTVREENAMAQAATGGGGELSAGDASYALYYVREDGQRQDGIFVLTHSHIAFTPDDAIRINGGTILFTYNRFEVTGGTGGDAVNIKAGSSGDFAYNFFYNLATNGLKSADTGPGVSGALETNFYNNTIINSGYRRAEPGRGAGLNYESDAYGKVYNNLLVNNRFGLRFVSGEDEPRVEEIGYGYNWYYGAVQSILDEVYPTDATASVGLIGNDPRAPIPTTDIVGGPGENDPEFVNFDPSTFVFSGNGSIATDPLRSNIEPIPDGADFHLSAGSPALTGGFTDFGPVHENYVSLDGQLTFTPPAPSEFFGAFGTN